MLEKIRTSTFLLAITVVLLLFSLTLLIFTCFWGLNDDAVMAMHIYGKGYSIEPTEYILYSNIIIGSILKKIYQAIPDYPWYGIYTMLILFISFIVLLYSLLTYKYSKTRILYFLLYFVLFGLWLIRMPQFTTNAVMAGMSGVFLFFTYLSEGKTAIISKFIVAFSILLLSLSFLIRPESFYLIVILSFSFITVEMLMHEYRKRALGKLLVLVIPLIIIIILSATYHRSAYLKDDNWAHMIKKIELGRELVDNNKAMEYSSRTKHIFDSVGWSLNDVIMLTNWFFIDDEVFGLVKREKVLREINNISLPRPMIYLEHMVRDKYFYGAVVLLIYFISQINMRQKIFFQIALSLLVSVFIILYMGYSVRLPDRVYMPILSYLAFLALFFVDKDIRPEEIKLWKGKLNILFVVIFMVFFIFIHYSFNAVRKKQNVVLKHSIARLDPEKDRIYLVWAKSLPLELLSVFDNLDDFADLKMLDITADFNDPRVMKVSKALNIKNFGELTGKDNLFHIGNLTYMALYARYLKEHYNLDVAFKIIEVNPLFMIYKHIEVNPDISRRIKTIPVNVAGVKYKVLAIQEQ
ncbi:hypothetical protein BMS3Abin10_00787 [bacterium BMS3Abin10]|nr:hypothetical protein BMS3Abin10_00787 [bacterium BMS3Abin10]GBE38329.1 hypothetical protein BMS3Bbin08_00934 [bacterium BMS3Bbin08]HDH51447.1 hypothetical protein [Nitrospirota bacterium]HDK17353.1 hypothetical protein [Nitrospirota bacterium]